MTSAQCIKLLKLRYFYYHKMFAHSMSYAQKTKMIGYYFMKLIHCFPVGLKKGSKILENERSKIPTNGKLFYMNRYSK